MNRHQQAIKNDTRDQKIAEYISTPIGETETGRTQYHTYEQAGQKFGVSYMTIYRIAKKLLDYLPGGERKFK